MQIYAVHKLDTWITPYQRYLADGVLPVDSTEARKIKKSSSKFTLCTAQVVGSDDVAASYYIGVLNGTPGWQKGRKSGARVVASY